MQNTLKHVHDLSDSQVVEAVKELFNIVYTRVPYKQIKDNSEAVAEVAQLASLDDEVMKHELSAVDSARFGRLVLEQYARDPELAPFVEQAWDKTQGSDNLIIDVILALGLVVNLTLLVATTRVQVQRGTDGKTSWTLGKKEAEPELVRAVVNPLVKVAKSAS
jgi:hypothetical protein